MAQERASYLVSECASFIDRRQDAMEYIDSTRTHLLKTEDADRAWSYCGRVFDLDMIQPVKHYFKQTCSVCQAAYDAEENAIATARQIKEQEEREKLKAWNAAASSFTPQNKSL